MINLDPLQLVSARKARVDRLAGMLGIDSWLLTTSHAVRTVTGAWSDEVDSLGEWASPVVAVGSSVLECALPPTDPRLVDEVADSLPLSGRVAVDRLGVSAMARLRELRPGLEILDAAPLIAGAKVPREPPEIDVLVEAHRRTEGVLSSMLEAVAPGISERELNAEFARLAAREGLYHLQVDTVFSVLPRDLSDAPWVRGEWEGKSPYRELTTDRVLTTGDHVAFDAGVGYGGYAADVGWTLLVGNRGPSPAEESLAAQWEEVAQRVIAAIRPGASAADLRAAALEGWDPARPPPWPYPLYVAHGIGTEPAEPPFAGADLSPEAEAAMTVADGHVLMVEPYIWEAGTGGYRAEYCVVATEDRTQVVSTLPYGRWPGT